MNVTRFFQDVLQSPLANARWSWGSVREDKNRVYLRVWKDEIDQDSRGRFVLVLRMPAHESSTGYHERRKHLQLIKEGARAYGIICIDQRQDGGSPRRIKAVVEDRVLALGELFDNERGTFARITADVTLIGIDLV